MWFHLTARTRGARTPFLDHSACAWAWSRLRQEFPVVAGAVLMPDHVHVLPEVASASDAQSRLGAVLGQISRLRGLGPCVWELPPTPAPIPNLEHLRRQVRYVALNPCREGLCRDPLEWLWSTHRDVAGAAAEPWLSEGELAVRLGQPRVGFADRHHRYVSADPSVDSRGTAPPRPAPEQNAPEIGLAQILAAAGASVRAAPGDWSRPGPARDHFLRLARRQGWRNASVLGRFLRMSPSGVARNLAKPFDSRGVAASALCLGDSRLRADVQFAVEFARVRG